VAKRQPRMSTVQQQQQHHRRKVLYDSQPLQELGDEWDDSAVDETVFLAGLETNAHVKRRSAAEVAAKSLAVGEQLGTVVAFVGVFANVARGTLGPWVLVAIDAALCLVALAATSSAPTAVVAVCKLVAAVAGVAPVLQSLMAAVSTDSVYLTTALLLVVHLFSRGFSVSPQQLSPVAITSAVFASVLLASRLPTALHAFGITVYAVVLFALFPHVRASSSSPPSASARLKRDNHNNHGSAFAKRHFVVLLSLVMVNAMLLWPISHAAFGAFVAALVFMCGVCPIWLVRIQKTKRCVGAVVVCLNLCFSLPLGSIHVPLSHIITERSTAHGTRRCLCSHQQRLRHHYHR